jgi:hypothetical protein
MRIHEEFATTRDARQALLRTTVTHLFKRKPDDYTQLIHAYDNAKAYLEAGKASPFDESAHAAAFEANVSVGALVEITREVFNIYRPAGCTLSPHARSELEVKFLAWATEHVAEGIARGKEIEREEASRKLPGPSSPGAAFLADPLLSSDSEDEDSDDTGDVGLPSSDPSSLLTRSNLDLLEETIPYPAFRQVLSPY